MIVRVLKVVVVSFLLFLFFSCKKKNERLFDGEWQLASYNGENEGTNSGWHYLYLYNFDGVNMTETIDGFWNGPPAMNKDTQFVNTYPYSLDLSIDKEGSYIQTINHSGNITSKSGSYSWKNKERTVISLEGMGTFTVSGGMKEEMNMLSSSSSSSMGNYSSSSKSYIFKRQ